MDEELRNHLSALFRVRVATPRIESPEAAPVHIRSIQVNLAKGAGREWLIRRLTEPSREFGTSLEPAPHGLSVAVRPE